MEAFLQQLSDASGGALARARSVIPTGGTAIEVKGAAAQRDRIKILRESLSRSLVRPSILVDCDAIVSFIIFVFFNFARVAPQFNQLLICSPETTAERLRSFFAFFRAANAELPVSPSPRIFVLVTPSALLPDLSRAFDAEVADLRRLPLGSARLIPIANDLVESQTFKKLFFSHSPVHLTAGYDWSALGTTYFRTSVPSFICWSAKPRVGKTHLILSNIVANHPNDHYYARILVDTDTTCEELVTVLKAPQAAAGTGAIICYHFNVDGGISQLFGYHILLLVLFRGLSDGNTIPFVNDHRTRFYFEFGSRPDAAAFVEREFPIGKHMQLLVPPPDPQFFSYDEYSVATHRITKHLNGKKHLIETVALLQLEQQWSVSQLASFPRMVDNARSAGLAIGYDILLSMFRKPAFDECIRTATPLISQLSDTAKFVSLFKGPVFSKSYAVQESLTPQAHLRRMSLVLLFETAVISCGIPYDARDARVTATERDAQRVDLVKLIHAKCARLLIIAEPLAQKPDSVRALVKESRPGVENFRFPQLEGMNPIRLIEQWQKETENSQLRLIEELGEIFAMEVYNPRHFRPAHAYLLFENLGVKERADLAHHFANEKVITRLMKGPSLSRREENQKGIPADERVFPATVNANIDKFIQRCREGLKATLEVDPDFSAGAKSLDELIDAIRQYILKESMLLSYSMTPHSLECFLHLAYRVLSAVPAVLMGETGSGKTYSIRFLKEICGERATIITRVFDGGTPVSEICPWVHNTIAGFNAGSGNLLIFFFNEVNTAPCQWFIKELIVDRFLDGEQLPDYVRFICAVNPSRRLNPLIVGRLRGLRHTGHATSEVTLVYRVCEMPESFMPFLLSADPPRDLPKGLAPEDLSQTTEHENYVERVVRQRLEEAAFLTHASAPHFSETQAFSAPLSPATLTGLGLTGDLYTTLKQIVSVIGRLAIYADRLMTHESGFDGDPSFGSLREPQRCAHLIRWFFQFGVEQEVSKEGRFRLSVLLALAVTYWLKLSDFSATPDKPCDRADFISKLCAVWRGLPDVPAFLRAPMADEFVTAVDAECRAFADLFVDQDEGLSKNAPLRENIWAAYVCITNNIPLWIIGMPGTSKSLAINIVLSKLFLRRVSSPKVTQLPPLVFQTFMCAVDSRSDALLSQLGRLAEQARSLSAMGVLLLEEIGAADISRLHCPTDL
jgi:hypothetical protein